MEPQRPPDSASGAALRILHLTVTIERGGAENYLADLIRSQRHDWNATVGCAYLKGAPYWRRELEDLGVSVVDLQMKTYADIRVLLRLRREIQRFSPDVLHVHGASAEIIGTAATLFSRRPKILFTRHEPRRRLFKIPGYWLIDAIISRSVDGIVAVSRAILDEDIKRQPILKNKSRVIHHGISDDFPISNSLARAKLRSDLGVAEGTVLIGAISRHTPEKSIDTLLHAYAKLQGLGGKPDTYLVIVGKGPLTADLKALADELGISESITWFEFRDDIPAFLNSLDIFALPSLEEGFGLVLLEAMVCGLPVIACAVDAIPEIVVHGKTGILVRPRDPQAMADGLMQLIEKPQLRSKMGTASRFRTVQNFSLDAMRRNTLEAYRELKSGGRIAL